MFPPDFFSKTKTSSGYMSERSSSTGILYLGEKECNLKQFSENEDDKMLINLINNSQSQSSRPKSLNSASTPIIIRSESLSPVNTNRNKNLYDLKCTGFEMIPEEDEEKIKTEYESSKKFFDAKKLEQFTSFNEKLLENAIFMPEESKNISDLIKETYRVPSSPNKKFRVKTPNKNLSVKLETKTLVNSDSKESETTTAESKKNNNQQSCFDFSKLNLNSNVRTLSNLSQNSNNLKIESPSNKKANEIKKTLDPSPQNFLENKKLPAQDNKNKANVKRTQSITKTTENKFRDFKPQTPPEVLNTVKLPPITTRRRLTPLSKNSNLDLGKIFQAADSHKEDPIIQKKLDDIMQNIADIKNVLDQKHKTRVKIASAPDQTEKIFSRQLGYNKNSINYDFKTKASTANNEVRERKMVLNSISNNSASDGKESALFKIKKDKIPIKLVKKDMKTGTNIL